MKFGQEPRELHVLCSVCTVQYGIDINSSIVPNAIHPYKERWKEFERANFSIWTQNIQKKNNLDLFHDVIFFRF
jgi:hypothetical protein